MRIHELPADPGRKQKKKRLGRGHGSGQGKTSGKGHKGHKARAGGGKGKGFEGGQMPLIRRIPKGGFLPPSQTEYDVVNLSSLDKSFESGATVDIAALKKARLVKGAKPVKILGTGTLTKKLSITADAASETATAKIAEAGGSFSLVKPKAEPIKGKMKKKEPKEKITRLEKKKAKKA